MPSTEGNAGCLIGLFRCFIGKRPITYPYRVRDDFLSPAELSMYHVLKHVVGPRAEIVTKVRLADLFFVQRPHENPAAFNRISQRHIDFLICQPHTMRPLLGIELDDASHARADRVERDAFLDQAFSVAGLPLVRIKARQTYNTQDLDATISPYIDATASVPHMTVPDPTPAAPTSTQSTAPNAETPAPSCPKCGERMVIRIGRQGAHRGKRFYGCPNYPKCRMVLPVE